MLFLDVIAVEPEVTGSSGLSVAVIALLVLAVAVGGFFVVRAILKNRKK
ncbi:MAG: hypothetical protein MJ118_04950 [Clostridia bacterium]|nr:hypothetical protein [Clostridia bacterium]